ncbi:hypothetical protein [Thiolapillus sp.]
MTHGLRLILIMIPGLISLNCQASNWQWLHNSSLGELSEADWAAMSATLQDALETAADGESRHWSNGKSGRQGDILILDSFREGQLACRQVRFSPKPDNGAETGPLTFCRDASKGWLIRSPSAGQ